MIKAMISHASEDDAFVDYLYEKLDRENLGLDIFVDHKRNLIGDEAQKMIDAAKQSIIFIPVLSNYAFGNDFINNERKAAHDSPTTYLFPVRFNCDEDKIPSDINIKAPKHNKVAGIIYGDFSNRSEWDLRYEKLLESIVTKLTELDMYQKDEFFYQDVEHIDLILARDNPSPAEMKTIVAIYREKEAYQYYFFKRLKNLRWLDFLRPYGFFNHNPKPIEVENQAGSYRVPRWSVLDYLEWYSGQINEGADSKYGEAIMAIVRSVSKYRDENGDRIDNHITDWVFIKIMANLPDCFVEIDDIEIIRQFFDSRWGSTLVGSEVGRKLLPAMLEHKQKEKVLKLLDIATSIKWTDRNGENEPDCLMETYWLNDLLEKNMSKISDLFPIEAAEIFIGRIVEITERKEIEFNIFQIPAIEDHPQNELHSNDFQNIFVKASRDLLNAAVRKDLKRAESLLSSLFERKHPIFKRLAISIASTNWKTCSSLFQSFAGRHLLNDYNLKHETYVLLRDNFGHFAQEEKDNIIRWIEVGPDREDDESEEHCEERLAYWKESWLSALIPSGYAKGTELYERYKTITGIEPEHPDFSSWMEVGWGPDPSPIGVETLLQKNNAEIAAYLNSYKDETRKWRGPSKEGLEEAILQAVKFNPTKFDTDLEPFLSVPLNYQCELIHGFRNAWEGKKEISWVNVLKFCRQVTSVEEFWVRSYQGSEYNYRNRVISEIADLLIEGTKEDSRAFQAEYLPIAGELIMAMLEKTEADLQNSDDLLFDVLNSAKGRLLSALINYSLRVARLNKDKEAAVRWPENVKAEFTRRLNCTIEPDLKFSVTLGRYLPNLYYLDEEWVRTNINCIFTKESEEHWQAAMEGYLLGGRFYDHLYELLRMNSHYGKAIGTEFKNKEVRKHLIHHLCIGYLIGKEELGDSNSLLSKCLTEWRTTDVLEMISFFWIQREYIGEYKTENNSEENLTGLKTDQKGRILDFWRIIYERVKNKAKYTDDEERVICDLGKLACFLEEIDDETLAWLKLSARHIEKDFNSSFFIEYLLRLVDVSPREVSVIYLEMLDYATPIYGKEHIKSIATKLYSSGEIENANKICNIYGSQGLDFLRDIYKQNQ